METIVNMELYEKYIERNTMKFSISLEDLNNTLLKLIDVYKLLSINEAFFYFIKNEIGADLENTGHDNSDLLCWCQIKKRTDSNKDWYYYTFDSDEDYYEYKGNYKFIKDTVLSTTVLNFFESNCIEIIADKNKNIK